MEGWLVQTWLPSGKSVHVCPQFSIGSDEDDSPGLSIKAPCAKALPSVGLQSDQSPQHSGRYWTQPSLSRTHRSLEQLAQVPDAYLIPNPE